MTNYLIALLFALCSVYLLFVTNHAIATAKSKCEDEPDKLPKETLREVAGSLIAKSIFLLGIVSFGVVSTKFQAHSWVESIIFSLICAFVFGGASGGILGAVVGFGAYVGASQPRNSTKVIALTLQSILCLLLGMLVFV